MMIKRILTICAAVTAGAAGTSLALAQGYPVPPAPVYSTAPQPYPRGGYPADYRRAPDAADLDLMDDDEAPNAQSSSRLWLSQSCQQALQFSRLLRILRLLQM